MKGKIDEKFALEQRLKLGEFIRQKRKEKGLTQDALGKLMGFDPTNIIKMEKGRWNFGIDTLALFALHLDFKWPPELPKE